MKKLLLISAMLISMASEAVAQQALNSHVNVTSPEVTDSTVTFRLYAPEAKNVALLSEMAKAPVTMTRGSDGVWSTTVAFPRHDLFIYNFLLDGVKIADPSNPYTVRDISSTFSYFITPDTWYDTRDVPHGAVSHPWYDSPALGMNRRMTVYTPAAYQKYPDRRFPVLYLLHGMGGDETAWTDLGRVAQILDNMIEKGAINPMIVVMPNGNSTQAAAPGQTGEGNYVTTGSRSVSPKDSFEKSFPDIVGFVDRNYRTIADADHRAVAGLSMGGGHTWRIQQLYPEMASYFGMFSAAVGWKGDPERLARQEDILPAAPAPRLYWISIGKDDFLYKLNENFRKTLDDNHVHYAYLESDGGHTWNNWRLYLTTFLMNIFLPD